MRWGVVGRDSQPSWRRVGWDGLGSACGKWERTEVISGPYVVIDRELEETMEVFFHLITTNEAPTMHQALWQVPRIHLWARQGRPPLF